MPIHLTIFVRVGMHFEGLRVHPFFPLTKPVAKQVSARLARRGRGGGIVRVSVQYGLELKLKLVYF